MYDTAYNLCILKPSNLSYRYSEIKHFIYFCNNVNHSKFIITLYNNTPTGKYMKLTTGIILQNRILIVTFPNHSCILTKYNYVR